jgi:putative transcriptional regulator
MLNRPTMSRRALLAFATLALATTAPASHRDPAQLKPGLFLYAAPAQQDPNFAESVVLLIEHGSQGSMGLVVNRPTRVPLRELLRGVDGLEGRDLRFHWGGPVQPEAILALVRTPWPSESARRVLPDVYLTGDLADVRAALAAKEPGEKLRVFTGYAGWGKGQLATELRAGFWVLDRADARSIFTPDTSELWFRVYRILERLEARSGQRPPRPVMAGSSSAARDAGSGVRRGYRRTFGAP